MEKETKKGAEKIQTVRKQKLFTALLTMNYVPGSEVLFQANRHMAYIVDIFLEKYLPVLVSKIFIFSVLLYKQFYTYKTFLVVYS